MWVHMGNAAEQVAAHSGLDVLLAEGATLPAGLPFACMPPSACTLLLPTCLQGDACNLPAELGPVDAGGVGSSWLAGCGSIHSLWLYVTACMSHPCTATVIRGSITYLRHGGSSLLPLGAALHSSSSATPSLFPGQCWRPTCCAGYPTRASSCAACPPS